MFLILEHLHNPVFSLFQTPCGHNFCLKCFQKWIGQGKRTCANCRNPIPAKMASQPRINSALVIAIRMAKMTKSNAAGGPARVYHFVRNQDRPDKAFTSERAKKAGKANASSGKIFVTVPPDHLGPILAENDPERNQGVLVGESWVGNGVSIFLLFQGLLGSRVMVLNQWSSLEAMKTMRTMASGSFTQGGIFLSALLMFILEFCLYCLFGLLFTVFLFLM